MVRQVTNGTHCGSIAHCGPVRYRSGEGTVLMQKDFHSKAITRQRDCKACKALKEKNRTGTVPKGPGSVHHPTDIPGSDLIFKESCFDDSTRPPVLLHIPYL